MFSWELWVSAYPGWRLEKRHLPWRTVRFFSTLLCLTSRRGIVSSGVDCVNSESRRHDLIDSFRSPFPKAKLGGKYSRRGHVSTVS